MIKEWSDEAWEEFLEQLKKDKNFLKRLEKILKDIERNGYKGIGKPEPLRFGFLAIGVEELMTITELFIRLKMVE